MYILTNIKMELSVARLANHYNMVEGTLSNISAIDEAAEGT